MNFETWFEEQQLLLSAPVMRKSAPERSGIAYIGCVLDESSQDHLVRVADKFLRTYQRPDGEKGFYGPQTGIPKTFSVKAHHMTIQFGRNARLEDFENSLYPAFGSEVELLVTAFAADKHCVAACVRPQQKLPNISSGYPHVTIAHSADVQPKYSIDVCANAPHIGLKETLVLKSYLVVVYHGGNYWPEVEGLARPSGRPE